MTSGPYIGRSPATEDLLDLRERGIQERRAPDVESPGDAGDTPELRAALEFQLLTLTRDLAEVGGPSTEVGEQILRLRNFLASFYGRATGERPPLPTRTTAASSLPEGSEEAAVNERLGVDGREESSGYRP